MCSTKSQSVNVAESVEIARDDEEIIEVVLAISTLNKSADDEDDEFLLADAVMHGKVQQTGRLHAKNSILSYSCSLMSAGPLRWSTMQESKSPRRRKHTPNPGNMLKKKKKKLQYVKRKRA